MIADVVVTEATFRAAIVAATNTALGALAASTGVSWADGAREFAERRVLLSIVSSVEDWALEELLENSQRVSASQDVRVQFMAESTYDSGDEDARDLLHQLRFGLLRLSVRDALGTAGVSIVGTASAITRFSYLHGGRRISAHAFEAAFRAVFGQTFTDEDAGLIEHVEWGGEVEDDQGATAAVGPVTTDDPDPLP